MSKRAARPGALVSTDTAAFGAVNPADFPDDLFGQPRHPRNPISHSQIEIALSRSVAGVAVVFALQTLPLMLGQLESRKPGSAVPIGIALGLSILVFVVATLVRRGIRTTAGIIAAVYLIALIVWPLVMRDPTAVLDSKPWLWYLCTVATSCAAIAFPLLWAIIYTVVTPVVFGLVRVLPSGGAAENLLAALDTCYAMLLGGVVLIIIYVLRDATDKVDTAQSNALAKYAVAVRHHATEMERVEVDSIVHDSVLATLLSAAGVRNAKGAELAAAMARSAIIRLQEANGERTLDDATTDVSRLVDRLRGAALNNGAFTVAERGIDGLSIPEFVAEALYAASVQAMVNSVQHAGPAQMRSLMICGNGQSGCRIEISDTGCGFDPTSVASARLGVRVSIRDRIASVGGVAVVNSSPGQGTTVVISWPRAEVSADSETDGGSDAGLRMAPASVEYAVTSLDADRAGDR
ncbi:ATP-binding protein [Cryobacterium sp. TMS1-20-1]|uniref:sensor histidine kinase n=1 Tax=Cryobacterium sp. TMS1-20-1 TaxID=1259223 RepID=UPI00106D6172|nr:ATP-binding protein [Cryobacterium sp. TMS1-20-1]TFC72426.1 ATP-binding protein [Cryobacterium sp. TMS1-20-1]